MAALHNAFKSYQDENRFWSYRETLFETIAVLWISTCISAELVKRYFPVWRASRIDPEAESLGFLWRMLGYGEDRCFWDRALSFWKPTNVSVCQNDSDIFPVFTDTVITIGYVGTYVTLIVAALLYLLFFYSLFINKSVRHPIQMLIIPAFHQIEKLFKICGRQPKHCTGLNPEPEPGIKPCTDNCNRPIQREDAKCSCRDLGRCILGLVLGILIVIPAVVIGSLGIGCLVWVVIVLWTVVLLLPVVVVATGVARTASDILGEDAIFPCYVFLALVLMIYSAGRMIGLWMRPSYLLWICNVTKKNKTTGSDSNINSEASFGTVVEQRSHFVVSKIVGYLLATYFFALAIGVKMEFRLFGLFQTQISDYESYGTNTTNGTGSTDSSFNGTKRLRYWSAIESYWVKNSTRYDYTILPEPSVLAETVGSFCDTWTTVLVYFLILYQFLGLIVYFIHEHAVGNVRKRHDPTNKHYPKWYTYMYDQRPQLAKCCCSVTLLYVLFYTIFETPLFAILVLPFPILNAFIPEHYHLPGLIVINTACAVGALSTTAQWLRAHWQEYKRYPYDPLGEKLSCGKHPVCGNYRRKADKRECEPVEEGSRAEGEPILEVTVEETGIMRSA